MKLNRMQLRNLIKEVMDSGIDWFEAGFNDAVNDATPSSPPTHPQSAVDDYWDGYQEGEDVIRNSSYSAEQGIVETIDYDPLGDSGTPHVGSKKFALAFVDAAYGDRRIELVINAEDSELARMVMKKIRKQGQTSGVQQTRRKFDHREVTTRQELLKMLG